MACSCVIFSIIGVILAAFALLKIYIKVTTRWCRSQTCLAGKTVIVTGANTGIGYDSALDFAKRGARVILACRSQEKAEAARSKIVEETGNENVVVKILNLNSLESVRAFAKDINATESHLDILVNNAGAVGLGDSKTEDGLQILMQVNYFSSFLLTNLLIGLLKKSAPSRIVNVSSYAAKWAKIDLDKLNEFVGDLNEYSLTKACNILFTKELAKKLQGTGVTAYSLHPGAIKTEILRNTGGAVGLLTTFLSNTLFKTSEEGAQTTIYAAVAKGLEKHSGEHLSDCEVVPPYSTVTDPGLPLKLWEKTEVLIKLKPEELQF